MRSRVLALAGAGVVLALIACSSDPERPPPAGDSSGTPGVPGSNAGGGGGSDAGGRDSSTSDAGNSGVCNSLPNNGVVVSEAEQLGDPPLSNGGTIVDGDYDLTQANIYVGINAGSAPVGVTVQSSLNITAGVIQQVLATGTQTSAAVESRSTQSFTVTTSTIVLTNTCPTAGLVTSQVYTASDTQLILTNPSTKEVFTFTKR